MHVDNPKEATSGYEHKVVYLLIATLILNLVYPISEQGLMWGILFNFIYTTIAVAMSVVVRGHRTQFILFVWLATMVLVVGTLSALLPDTIFPVVATAATFTLQVAILWLMVGFIFRSPRVTRGVLFAGITVYLLIADTFMPIYNLIEQLFPGSFVASTGVALSWQRFLYFSFATLTTLGYGDITPVTPMAQAVVGMEAVIGVLYIAILMSRLVGLYRNEDEPHGAG